MSWSAGRAVVVAVLSTATLWSIPDTANEHFEVDDQGNLRSVDGHPSGLTNRRGPTPAPGQPSAN
jgi:hypothetical protein